MIQDSQPTMHLTEGQRTPLFIATAVLSTIAIFALFMWEGSKGFYLTDEGYLWYGAQRALLGEVPICDFMSYDPGRYYWAAGFMSLWGDNGILTLRAAVAVFQALGLFVGLYLIVGASPRHRLLYALLSALTLTGWMFPYHKMFDISVSIFLIGALSFLARSRTRNGPLLCRRVRGIGSRLRLQPWRIRCCRQPCCDGSPEHKANHGSWLRNGCRALGRRHHCRIRSHTFHGSPGPGFCSGVW